MIDLSTNYLGIKLKHPFVPSSSPFTRSVDGAKRLEDAGASALVMHSLFEEEIHQDQAQQMRFIEQQHTGFGEADSFLPHNYYSFNSLLDDYLELFESVQSSLDIPLIASLNGVTEQGWLEYAIQLQKLGAAAIELNVYHIPTTHSETATDIEQRYYQLLQVLKQQITIPITMKLSHQFSAPVHFIHQLQQHGAQGVSLFNRFYQPDIDIDTRTLTPSLQLSSREEALLRIRWIGMLRDQVDLSIAATGGFHRIEEAIKALMVGADVVHLCSVLLKQGPHWLTGLVDQLKEWLELHEYQSVQQLKGSVSLHKSANPDVYARSNYIHMLENYQIPDSILV